MRHTSVLRRFVLSVFFFHSLRVLCEEHVSDDLPFTQEIKNPTEEYKHIFKSIPLLFEHLLSALQDKPEVLETDNLMAFNDVSNPSLKIKKRDLHNKIDFNKLPESFNKKVRLGSEDEFNIIEHDTSGINTNNKHSKANGKALYSADENLRQITESKSYTKMFDHGLVDSLKSNDKRDILSQLAAYFGFTGSDNNEQEQEATDVYDAVDEDEKTGSDGESPHTQSNDDCDHDDCIQLQFTIDEAVDKILMVEKLLEDYQEESK